MPIFTQEDLQKQTIVELKEICRKYNIKHGTMFFKFLLIKLHIL